MKKRITAGLLLVVILSMVYLCVAHIKPDEPEACLLCDSAPYHAPCVLNVSTGSITELAAYDLHPVKVAELAEIQSGGYFEISTRNGLFARRDPDAHETSASIPICKDRIKQSLFCKSCGEHLASVSECGYVLLDLYDSTMSRAYPLCDGAVWEMRCYTINITRSNAAEEYTVVIKGSLESEQI